MEHTARLLFLLLLLWPLPIPISSLLIPACFLFLEIWEEKEKEGGNRDGARERRCATFLQCFQKQIYQLPASPDWLWLLCACVYNILSFFAGSQRVAEESLYLFFICERFLSFSKNASFDLFNLICGLTELKLQYVQVSYVSVPMLHALFYVIMRLKTHWRRQENLSR